MRLIRTTDVEIQFAAVLVYNSGLTPLLNQLRNEAGPTRLVGSASAATVVSVKIFKKPEVFAKVGIAL